MPGEIKLRILISRRLCFWEGDRPTPYLDSHCYCPLHSYIWCHIIQLPTNSWFSLILSCLDTKLFANDKIQLAFNFLQEIGKIVRNNENGYYQRDRTQSWSTLCMRVEQKVWLFQKLSSSEGSLFVVANRAGGGQTDKLASTTSSAWLFLKQQKYKPDNPIIFLKQW